jgi:hypothetical protein
MQNDREVSLLAAEVGQERSRPLVILHVVQDFSPAIGRPEGLHYISQKTSLCRSYENIYHMLS